MRKGDRTLRLSTKIICRHAKSRHQRGQHELIAILILATPSIVPVTVSRFHRFGKSSGHYIGKQGSLDRLKLANKRPVNPWERLDCWSRAQNHPFSDSGLQSSTGSFIVRPDSPPTLYRLLVVSEQFRWKSGFLRRASSGISLRSAISHIMISSQSVSRYVQPILIRADERLR